MTQQRRFRIESRPARWALLVLAIFLVVFLRSPEVLLLPSLEAEDGTFVFQHFYVHRDAAEIFREKSGYVPLVANLMAYASVRLPTRAIPYGFAWIPLLVTLAAYAWLFGERYREWLGADATRATICLLFALAPLSQWHLLASVDYSIWNTLLLLLLLAVAPWPRATWAKGASWAAANLLVWSHPLAILAAPFFAWRLARERDARALNALTLANLAVHQAIGVESGGVFAGLTWVETAVRLWNSFCWTFVIAASTAFRAAFGTVASEWADSGHWVPVAAWAVFLVAVSVVAARRSPRLRAVFGVLAYVIFTVTFFSMLVRSPALVFPLNGAPRYVYLPSLAFLVLFVLLIDHFCCSSREARAGAGEAADGEVVAAEEPAAAPAADRARRSRRRLAALGAVVLWYVALNAQIGHYFVATGPAARPTDGGRMSPYIQADPDAGRDVREFFAELERLERRNGSRDGIHLVLDEPYRWPITIDTREPEGGR